MSIESILSVNKLGFAYERQRIEVASNNIAKANIPISPNASQFEVGALDNSQSANTMDETNNSATRTVHDPGHPMADKNGMVHYPSTDLVNEMTTLLSASRGYEANVRSYNIIRNMTMKALEIGAK